MFVFALLLGADRTEAAWHGTTAASFALAYVFLVALPLGGRARVAFAILVFFLTAAARWLFSRDLIGASASALGMTVVLFALGASGRRRTREDAARPPGSSQGNLDRAG